VTTEKTSITMFGTVAVAVAVVAVAWLLRMNSAMQSVPDFIRKASPRRWTTKELRDTYDRVKQNPTDFASLLPPCLERRYVIVGGSGEPHPTGPRPAKTFLGLR
jgi:hypothetical protein